MSDVERLEGEPDGELRLCRHLSSFGRPGSSLHRLHLGVPVVCLTVRLLILQRKSSDIDLSGWK